MQQVASPVPMNRTKHRHRVDGVNARLRAQMEDAAMDRYPDEGLVHPVPRRVQTVRAHLHPCRCEGRHHAGCAERHRPAEQTA